MPSFGEKLRQEREARDITLGQVADATKISRRYLNALECNDFRDLPGGVFNRGFVRAYAQYLGVDAQAMVEAYVREERAVAPEDDAAALDALRAALDAAARARRGTTQTRAPKTKVLWLGLLVLLAAVSLAIGGWFTFGPSRSDGGPAERTLAARNVGNDPGREASSTGATGPDDPVAAGLGAGPAESDAGGHAPDEASEDETRPKAGTLEAEAETAERKVVPVAAGGRSDAVAGGAPEPSPPEPGTGAPRPRGPERVVADLADSVASPEQPRAPVDPGDGVQLSVPDSGVGTAVVHHRLRGRGGRFAEGTEVWFWTRVIGGEPGQSVRHVWIHDGVEVGSAELPLGGSHWRTQSRRTLPPGSAGLWSVEARDPAGRVLAREEFVCVPGTGTPPPR